MLYATWYEFKKDFEKELGHGLSNWDWLAAKPKSPLPWNHGHMKRAISALSRFEDRKVVRKRTK